MLIYDNTGKLLMDVPVVDYRKLEEKVAKPMEIVGLNQVN